MKTQYFIWLIIGIVFANSCRDKNIQLEDPIPVGPNVDTVSFSVDVNPIIESSCLDADCHASNSPWGDFTIYAGLKAKINNSGQPFRRRVIDIRDMPKGGQLSEQEILTLRLWLDQGAPNN